MKKKVNTKDAEQKLKAISRLLEEYEYMIPVEFYLIARNILDNKMS